GYSLIGSSGSAIRPAVKMMIDSTAAKIGRSTKKRERFMAGSRCSRGPLRRAADRGGLQAGRSRLLHGDDLRLHLHAGEEHFLHAVDDHAIARLQAIGDDHETVTGAAEL